MELKELGTVCDLQNGYAFKSGDYVEVSDTVSLRMSNIRPGGSFDSSYNLRFLPSSFRDTYSKYIINNGDLVIAMTDLANDPKILGIPTIVETGKLNWLLNQRAGKLVILDNSKTDKNYLRYILNHPIHRNYYKKFAGGGLQINVGKKEILGCKIPLPPLKTQQRIAAILDDAAALRDKTAQLLTEYDLLAQSIFLEMFGDPGMNENKENFLELKTLIVQKPDNGFFAKKDKYGQEGTPIVWLNNFIDKLYVEQEGLRRSQILAKDEKYSLEYGDTLFCRSSLTAEGIGKCAIVPKELNEQTLFECHIIRLKFNLKKVIPEYFRFLSDTRYFRANIEKRSKTSTMTTISQDGITDIKIPVPSIELQNEFADKIALIEQQKALAKQELQESEDLFNCLLQKAFKGELV